MNGYKLVPVEPTQEMVEAAADAYMPFGDMDLALRMAILAATVVQGEPQPAEQQPAPDVAGMVDALEWLRGAINATPENDKDQAGTWISTSHPRIKQIDELLAAHRKQQEGEA